MRKYVMPLALLTVVTLVFGTIYTSVQQSQRLSANDPQIQIAEDTAAQLDAGAPPRALVTGSVDAVKSLAPFTTIYDKKGNQIASSGYISGQPLQSIPLGVLKHSGPGYNAVTWQPQSNLRLASVSVESADYYVTVARSLREVEKRENITFQLVAMGWLTSILVFVCAYWVGPRLGIIRTTKKS